MSKVVDIREYGAIQGIKRARPKWKACFPDELTHNTGLADLSDSTLLNMALLGDVVMGALQDLVMNVLGLGGPEGFDGLKGQPKIRVIDITLFLVDQVRWECLGRLGWIHGYPGEEYTLAELILQHDRIKREYRPAFPQLKENHAHYEEFQRRRDIDGEAMIRSMIPTALAAFGVKKRP